jgi:adenylate cyclase
VPARQEAIASDTRALHAWLTEAGLAGLPLVELLDGLCGRLVAAGLPLARAYLSRAAVHPLLWAMGVTWQDGRIVGAIDLGFGFEKDAAWLDSPFRHMLDKDLRQLRRRLAGDGAVVDYPVLAELRDAGLTDWVAFLHRFGWTVEHEQIGQLGAISSWATARAGGWSGGEIALLAGLAPTLALAVKAGTGHSTTRDLLTTYLGADAAERVIAGHAQRGSVTRRTAVILYADLRGFTDFADAAAPEEVTRRLNGCFDCMGEPIRAAGGEILKFLGDGLLAVFLPGAGRDVAAVAAAALDAAQDILARIARLNTAEVAAGNPALPLDIALHEGEVTYGNVGTAERLDFTVIGPTVNEAARLEALCKELGRPLLVSDALVSFAPALRPRLIALGRYRLRGVRQGREVFGAAP